MQRHLKKTEIVSVLYLVACETLPRTEVINETVIFPFQQMKKLNKIQLCSFLSFQTDGPLTGVSARIVLTDSLGNPLQNNRTISVLGGVTVPNNLTFALNSWSGSDIVEFPNDFLCGGFILQWVSIPGNADIQFNENENYFNFFFETDYIENI